MGWKATDMPDQAGRRVVVTGANSGIGLQAALELARRGASVVLACRNAGKGEEALGRIRAEVPDADVEVRALDLADLSSVRAFAATVDGLDLLVNNAGVMAPPREETADGFELQLGTNHLGHFALTGLVLPVLLRGQAPRVVTISSTAHKIGKIAFDDLQREHGYNRWTAYGQAKLANLMFALELARRAAAADADLLSVAAHPGYASTHLQTTGPGAGGGVVAALNSAFGKVGNAIFAQSDAAGALPTLYAATQDLPGGAFVGPGGIGEMRGAPTLVHPTKTAQDEDVARRLWAVSEELTGVSIEFARATA